MPMRTIIVVCAVTLLLFSPDVSARANGQLTVVATSGAKITVRGPSGKLLKPTISGQHHRLVRLRPGLYKVDVGGKTGSSFARTVLVSPKGSVTVEARPGKTPAPSIWIYGRRFQLNAPVKVVTHRDPGGMSFAREWQRGLTRGRPLFPRPGKPKNLAELQATIDKIIVHMDLTTGMKKTFRILAERGLSTHFGIDWDGTLYQFADPQRVAVHAGEHNARSIGIDLNNATKNLRTRPEWVAIYERQMKARGEKRRIFRGKVQGSEIAAFGYTEPQYRALDALLQVLVAAFPKVRPDTLRDARGKVQTEATESARIPGGILAHYQTSGSRWDPGPGFRWARVVANPRRLVKALAKYEPSRRCVMSCGTDGRCAFQQGKCVATAATCRTSFNCAQMGQCTLKKGRCVVGSDADCASTDGCKEEGLCAARRNRCVAASDKNCQGLDICKEEGRCAAKKGRCVAGTEQACRASSNCREDGLCVAKKGRCVATKKDCRQAKVCKAYGRCVAKRGVCKANSAADCKASEGCKDDGNCSLLKGECLPGNTAECRRADACESAGECTFVKGSCVVVSNADCERTEACGYEGLCTARNGRCEIGSDADCRKNEACTENGECAYRDGACVASTQTDCLASKRCKTRGACQLKATRCVAGSDARCRLAQICKAEGRCAAKGDVCVAVADADCQRSAACKATGSCVARRGACRAATAAHCLQSRVCKQNQQCRLDAGVCVRAP